MLNFKLQVSNIYLKIFSVLVFCLALFFIAGNALANDTSELQSTITDKEIFNDPVVFKQSVNMESTLTVEQPAYFTAGVHIGKTTGEGGVTYFNGTIINDSEGGVPVTFGDDVRIDGGIWRGGLLDGTVSPVKVYDDLKVSGRITSSGSINASSIYAKDTVFANEWVALSALKSQRNESIQAEPASAIGKDGRIAECSEKYYGHIIFSPKPLNGGRANQFYGCTGSGWKEL